MSEKPGRPPEDRFERRRQIWAAVGPLIEKRGARSLTMRQAAAAAFISLGGLYHYFPTKRALLLFGLSPDALERYCAELMAESGRFKDGNPAAYREWFIGMSASRIFFVRPAVVAALDLGARDFMSQFEATVNRGLNGFIAGFIEVLAVSLPETPDRDLRVAGALRLRQRGFFDRAMTRADFEEQLRCLLNEPSDVRAQALVPTA